MISIMLVKHLSLTRPGPLLGARALPARPGLIAGWAGLTSETTQNRYLVDGWHFRQATVQTCVLMRRANLGSQLTTHPLTSRS